MRKILKLLGTVIALSLTAPQAAEAAERWNMPTAYGASNFHTEVAVTFAEAVKRATDGTIEIVVHPGGSLFKGGEIKRAVQIGQVPIGERLAAALSNENPVFGLDAVPFLATSYDDAWRLYQASKPQLTELLEEQGLVLLYATPWPPQGLYTDRPINSVQDMQGMRFRSYNPVMSRLSELMGAVPTQIEEAELSQALATGVVNSMITSGATGVERKVWEHVSHFYNLQAWLPKNLVFVNQRAWDALDEKTQAAIRGAAAMAEIIGWQRSQELSDQYLETLAANGMTVTSPGPELSAGLVEIGQVMLREWLAQVGPMGSNIINAYHASN